MMTSSICITVLEQLVPIFLIFSFLIFFLPFAMVYVVTGSSTEKFGRLWSRQILQTKKFCDEGVVGPSFRCYVLYISTSLFFS